MMLGGTECCGSKSGRLLLREGVARTPNCTVNCTVRCEEHGVHVEHVELGSGVVSEAKSVSFFESIVYEIVSHVAHNPKVAGSNPAPATN